MPRQLPPIATRFPVNRKDRTKTGPYLTPLLKRLLEKKVNFEDPETKKLIKTSAGRGLMLRLIYNGIQGETPAIKEILERMDGKVEQKNINEMSGSLEVVTMGKIVKAGKEITLDVGDS